MEQKKSFLRKAAGFCGRKRFFLGAAVIALAMGSGFLTGSAYWGERRLDAHQLVKFQQRAAKKYREIYEALNRIDGDLHVRQDICASNLSEDLKNTALSGVKENRYDKHLALYLEKIRDAEPVFGKVAYTKMEDFNDDIRKIDADFASCAPEAGKLFAEPLWSARKIEIAGLLQEQLSVIDGLKNLASFEDYKLRVSK